MEIKIKQDDNFDWTFENELTLEDYIDEAFEESSEKQKNLLRRLSEKYLGKQKGE